MTCKGTSRLIKKRFQYDFVHFVLNSIPKDQFNPLSVNEIMGFLLSKWGVTYELRLLVKGKVLYLQIMWGYLEQQSFPLSEREYAENLARILDVINRLGKASEVRAWLLYIEGKPRIGRALSLPIRGNQLLGEFVL